MFIWADIFSKFEIHWYDANIIHIKFWSKSIEPFMTRSYLMISMMSAIMTALCIGEDFCMQIRKTSIQGWSILLHFIIHPEDGSIHDFPVKIHPIAYEKKLLRDFHDFSGFYFWKLERHGSKGAFYQVCSECI